MDLTNVEIPMRDGGMLAADVSLPAPTGRFPAVVSIYPYRKDDISGSFSEPARGFWLEAGYAHILVDSRGYGGSTGHAVESMDPGPEGHDGADVVEWVASQHWSDGNVGMYGVSYGGLAALATGAQAPEHLRAVASMYGLWDIHAQAIAPGRTPLCLGRYAREFVMLAQELMPPSYRDKSGRWQRVWRERLNLRSREGPNSLQWLARIDDADYWRRRVIPLERIKVPTFLLSGWRDLSPTATVQAFGKLKVAKRMLIGPWMHVMPDSAEESVDWLSEVGDFFDRHVRGIRSIADPPPVTIFVQQNGWRHERAWPIARTRWQVAYLADRGKLQAEAAPAGLGPPYFADPTVGLAAGLYDPLGLGFGAPGEQAPDDVSSLCYTTKRLRRSIEITGSPILTLAFVADTSQPIHLACKLIDVDADGRASLITTGWSKVTQAERITTIELMATSYAVPAGHRLRISVSCADFPRFWPTPGQAMIRIEHGASLIQLPTISRGSGLDHFPAPKPPAKPYRATRVISSSATWKATRDEIRRTVSVTTGASQSLRTTSGHLLSIHLRSTASVARHQPNGARVVGRVRLHLRLSEDESVTVLTGGTVSFGSVTYRGRIDLNGKTTFKKEWVSKQARRARLPNGLPRGRPRLLT